MFLAKMGSREGSSSWFNNVTTIIKCALHLTASGCHQTKPFSMLWPQNLITSRGTSPTFSSKTGDPNSMARSSDFMMSCTGEKKWSKTQRIFDLSVYSMFFAKCWIWSPVISIDHWNPSKSSESTDHSWLTGAKRREWGCMIYNHYNNYWSSSQL